MPRRAATCCSPIRARRGCEGARVLPWGGVASGCASASPIVLSRGQRLTEELRVDSTLSERRRSVRELRFGRGVVVIGTLLPSEQGRGCRRAQDNRRCFDAVLETLTQMVERDASADMIDGTVVRAHHCAVGIKRGSRKPRRLAERARMPMLSARSLPRQTSRPSPPPNAIGANPSRTIAKDTAGETSSRAC